MQKYGDKSHSNSSSSELFMEAVLGVRSALHVAEASEIAKNRYLITKTFHEIFRFEINCLAN